MDLNIRHATAISCKYIFTKNRSFKTEFYHKYWLMFNNWTTLLIFTAQDNLKIYWWV